MEQWVSWGAGRRFEVVSHAMWMTTQLGANQRPSLQALTSNAFTGSSCYAIYCRLKVSTVTCGMERTGLNSSMPTLFSNYLALTNLCQKSCYLLYGQSFISVTAECITLLFCRLSGDSTVYFQTKMLIIITLLLLNNTGYLMMFSST